MCRNAVTATIDDDWTRRLGRLLSATDAEHTLGIPASTVRTWAERQKIYSGGLSTQGHPVYWEVDLMALRHKRPVRDDNGDHLWSMDDAETW